MKVEKLIKIDGTNMFILGDLVYFDNDNYTHYYIIEDAYNFYKSVGEALNKKIVFRFLDDEVFIDKNTTLEDVKIQLLKQKQAKVEKVEEYNKIYDMYESYLIMNNDIRRKTNSLKPINVKEKIKINNKIND